MTLMLIGDKPYKPPMNDRERLEFVVRFIQIDLTALQQPGWVALYEEMYDFMRPTAKFSIGAQAADDRDKIIETQVSAREVLTDLVDAREGLLRRKTIAGRGIYHDMSMRFAVVPTTGLLYVGLLPAAFLFRLSLLLISGPVDSVRRCSASDCNKIFYRERGQKFCSERCQTRELMRRRRKDPKKAQKDAEKARIRYELRMKKKLGKNTKVKKRRAR